MIQKQFELIDKGDIDALIANGIGESRTLEYKQELPGPADENKKEFLADVSSFAKHDTFSKLHHIAELDVGHKFNEKLLLCFTQPSQRPVKV